MQLERVTKRFGSFVAVDDVSLSVPAGQTCGFIGPNGSGKTTTLRMIMRIYAPDAGVVRVLGQERGSSANDAVTYLPEERMLYKQMRVYDVLRFLAQLKGMRPTRREIDDWLERLQLPGVGRRKVATLSKGQSQKIQLIAVLITRPRLVLLDEPFSGLDPVNAVVLRDLVIDLRKTGTTVLFSTHDMPVAERMCDAIVMIYRGKKVLDGTLDSIQATYGQDTLHVRRAGGLTVPHDLPGTAAVTEVGRSTELRLQPDVDPQAVLAALMRLGGIELFELRRPDLQEIFMRIAGVGTDAGSGVDAGSSADADSGADAGTGVGTGAEIESGAGVGTGVGTDGGAGAGASTDDG